MLGVHSAGWSSALQPGCSTRGQWVSSPAWVPSTNWWLQSCWVQGWMPCLQSLLCRGACAQCLSSLPAHLAGCGVLELQEEALCPQGCGGPCVLQLATLMAFWVLLSAWGRASIRPAPEEVGSSKPLFQAEWGLWHTCPPPQGQWMGGRDVRLVPASDASHSPALSSWFLLLRCLGEGSHAEQVSGAGQQLSLSQGWLCLRPMLKV